MKSCLKTQGRNKGRLLKRVLRPIVAIFLSAAASTLDFLALTWLPPATIGVFGPSSLILPDQNHLSLGAHCLSSYACSPFP